MSVVYKIKKLIETENTNVKAFSNAIGISPKGVYKWTDDSIKLYTLIKVAEFFKKPLSYFLDDDGQKNYKSVAKLSPVAEEGEVYGAINYKEKYFETLEKLNTCNERLLAFTDLQKGLIKEKNKR